MRGHIYLSLVALLTARRRKTQLQTKGSTSIQSAVTSLWGPKAMENIVPLDITFDIEPERSVLKRLGQSDS